MRIRQTNIRDVNYLIKENRKLISSLSIFDSIVSLLLALSCLRLFRPLYLLYPKIAFKSYILELDCRNRIGFAYLQGDLGRDRLWFTLAIDKNLRGLGYGTTLLEHLIKDSKEMGVERLLGANFIDNKAVLRIETKLGFEPIMVYMGLNLKDSKEEK